MKKVLIIGISSCIGSNLATYLRKEYRVYGTYASRRPRIDGVPTFPLWIKPETPLREFLYNFKPDAVVYCPGITDTQRCEEQPLEAFFLHAQAPSIIASALAKYNGRLIYLSTSKVFSGEKGDYREDDKISPVSIYGKSKSVGEELLMPYRNIFILRLGTLFGLGAQGQNCMFHRILTSIQNGQELSLIFDEYRSFISMDLLSKIVGNCLDADEDTATTYHVGSSEKLSYYDFGKAVAYCLGKGADILRKISAVDFTATHNPLAVPRGNDLTLQSRLLSATFSIHTPTLAKSLESIRQKLHFGTQ